MSLILPALLIQLAGLAASDISPAGARASGIPGDYRIWRMVANTANSCRVLNAPPVQPPVQPTFDLSTYDPQYTLYQATQSITFEQGYTTPDGATLVAEIVPAGIPQATNLTGTPDLDINWIQTTAYDQNGNVISDDKDFFDNSGRNIQSQTKAFYRQSASTTITHVLASQTIRDAYGRDAVSTLAAPIDYADFSYQQKFVQHNQAGTNYTYHNFDYYYPGGPGNTSTPQSPDALWDANTGSPRQGSLAWYYSTSNTWEPYTSTTNYPFNQSTFYYDGTGTAKKKADAGEALVMGTGHQGGGYLTPVANELDFYLLVRNKYFAATDLGMLATSLQTQAMQTVAQDANGRETVSIQDRSGKALLTARAGTDQVVNNTVTVGGTANPDMNVWYFRLMGTGGSVTVTGGSFTLYDMGLESVLTSFSSGNSLPGGYYKLVNTGTTALTLKYSNGYSDISYNFYNQLGELVATITPEGVKKLYGTNGNGLSTYTSRSAIPFVSLFTYDGEGRVLTSQTPDEGSYTSGQYTGGTHTFYYRKDGKVRFSQTPNQARMTPYPAYSYTNYDASGRLVETGQYQPDNSGIQFNGTALTPILETTAAGGGLTTGTKTDVSITQFDFPDASYGSNVSSSYIQDAVNLGGAVSLTQKYSSITNNSPDPTKLQSATWFNYDEQGRTVWTIRYINGLGYKTTDYSYDAIGRVTKKVYQAGASTETFVHYYDYDPVTSKLWHVYTNTVDNQSSRLLQATYYYYLHGGVKRVELAGTLQGIDYTYTLRGALKAINNNNKNNDPGGDAIANSVSPDAFGEVLDYYTGDYTNGRSGQAAINGVNTASITSTTIPDSYAGNLKAMSWYSEKPTSVPNVTDAPVTNVFQYDPKYQFTENIWGTNLSTGAGPSSFTPTSNFKERIGNTSGGAPAYDENGNIQSLYRTDGSGNAIDQFTYNYNANTNQLSSVTEAGGGTYATFGYDPNGQMISEVIGDGSGPSSYVTYDVAGKVTGVYADAAYQHPAVQFVYDELGQRIKKLDYNSSYQLSQVTYYAGNVVYTQNVTGGGAPVALEYQIIGGGARIGIYNAVSQIYAYELTDHQGNVRAVIAQSGTTFQVRMYNDFYPYGKVISGGTEDYRYDYQGQYAEKDGERGWNNFQLRMYDSRLGRWFQRDPKGQFSSPYVGMGNNPVLGTDKDGGFFGTLIGAALGGLIEGISYKMDGKNFWEGAKRGAVRGAIAGSVFDAAYTGGTSLIAVGAFSGAISEMADQTFFGDGQVHFDKLAVSTVTGGVGGMFMEAAAPVARWIGNRLVTATVRAVEAPGNIGLEEAGQKIFDENIANDTHGAGELVTKYPAIGALAGTEERVFLQPGEIIDRFGSVYGKWYSVPGTSYGARSIPEGLGPYTQYRVLRPFEVTKSIVAPGNFSYQIGFGVQYESPVSTKVLLEKGIIEVVQ